MSTENALFLFDVSAYLHRAMHIVYGDRVATVSEDDSTFIKHASVMVANTMRDLSVRRMVLVRDSTEPSWRCDDYPAYKSDRRAHYPVFEKQAPRFFDAMAAIHVATLEEDRYEADDLIASFILEGCGQPIAIVSSDKDLMMHVSDTTRYFDPVKKKWISADMVSEKLEGLRPEQFTEFIALVGDKADGIPGVPGFGPKTAAKLLKHFHSIDGIYAQSDVELWKVISYKKIKALLRHKEDAFVSRRLATPDYFRDVEHRICGDIDAPSHTAVRAACEAL